MGNLSPKVAFISEFFLSIVYVSEQTFQYAVEIESRFDFLPITFNCVMTFVFYHEM